MLTSRNGDSKKDAAYKAARVQMRRKRAVSYSKARLAKLREFKSKYHLMMSARVSMISTIGNHAFFLQRMLVIWIVSSSANPSDSFAYNNKICDNILITKKYSNNRNE